MTQFTLTTSKCVAIFLLALASCNKVSAQTGDGNTSLLLTATPDRCVALRKGQTCYQQVDIQWQSPQAGKYCLSNITTNKVIKCWTDAKQGSYSFDFQADVSHQYALTQNDSGIHLATVQITLAWVYKSRERPKARWRLF